MVIWAEGNKFITAYIERVGNKIVEESEKVVMMPGTPIAAFDPEKELYNLSRDNSNIITLSNYASNGELKFLVPAFKNCFLKNS